MTIVWLLEQTSRLRARELAGSTYLVGEFREQLGVEEEISGCCELICHCIKEHFRTVISVLLVCALFRLYCCKAEAQDVGSVAEEDCFSA